MAWAKVGPCGQLCRQRLRFGQQRLGRAQAVEEAPLQRFLAAQRAAGVQQLGGAALADHARQQRARAHVGARQPHAHEQERRLAARGAQPQIGGQRQQSRRRRRTRRRSRR